MTISTSESQKLTRRRFLTGSAVAVTGLYLAACAPTAAPATGDEGAVAPAAEAVELIHWSFASNRVESSGGVRLLPEAEPRAHQPLRVVGDRIVGRARDAPGPELLQDRRVRLKELSGGQLRY